MDQTEANYRLHKLRFKRTLRQRMTPAERALWDALRNRKLQGKKWRRQANIAAFIADFLCPEHRLIVEVDGGIHECQKEHDELRTEVIKHYGYRVIRFTNEEILERLPTALQRITEAIAGEALTSRPPLH